MAFRPPRISRRKRYKLLVRVRKALGDTLFADFLIDVLSDNGNYSAVEQDLGILQEMWLKKQEHVVSASQLQPTRPPIHLQRPTA
jgi:hypothetical protein